MATRIWLSAKGVKSVQATDKEEFGKCVSTLGENGPRVETDNVNGEMYINIHGDIMDPTVSLPRIAHTLIKRVTYQGKIRDGFRTDGFYRAKGATLRVETGMEIHGTYAMQAQPIREDYQTISISGGSITSCQFIYNGVRNGSIRIESNWGLPQYQLPKPEAAEGPTH